MSYYERAIEQKDKLDSAKTLIEQSGSERIFDYRPATPEKDGVPAKPARSIVHGAVINETNRHVIAFVLNDKLTAQLIAEAIEELGSTVKTKALEIADNKLQNAFKSAETEVLEAKDYLDNWSA
jgi:hypothetical protein